MKFLLESTIDGDFLCTRYYTSDHYSFRFLKLDSTESGLNFGRFLHFTMDNFENEVSVDGTEFSDLVNWIVENINNLWTFENLYDDYAYKFCFKSEVDAIHFAMKWK